MAQHYSDPTREHDTYSLPDVETFTARYGDCPFCTSTVVEDGAGSFFCDQCQDGGKGQGVMPSEISTGWFYWFCFPGCMPDSDPMGPFATEAEALADAQQDSDNDDNDDDTDNDDETDTPNDEDIYANDPAGPFYYLGKVIAEDRPALRAWMTREGYFPNIWWTSDHGNQHQILDINDTDKD